MISIAGTWSGTGRFPRDMPIQDTFPLSFPIMDGNFPVMEVGVISHPTAGCGSLPILPVLIGGPITTEDGFGFPVVGSGLVMNPGDGWFITTEDGDGVQV